MIVCFSGTGNSRAVARELSRRLGDRVEFIRSMQDSRCLAVDEGERIVWVFPIYSWGVPPVVRNAIASIGFTAETGLHHMVSTCGDDVGYADRMWRRDIRRRGWRCGGCWSVEMPNTYVSLPGFDTDSRDVMLSKLRAMPDRIKDVARAISVGSKVEDVIRGGFPWLKTRVIYPFFTRFLMSPRLFRTTAACVGCGKCAGACPVGNIAMRPDNGGDARPQWGAGCAGCLACYHACPHHAVAYGHRTGSKHQYFYSEKIVK